MAQDANQVRTAQIQAQIEHTRAELGQTIAGIRDRLSPHRIMQRARQSISNATVGRARSHPTMTALIGTAVGALILAAISRSHRPRLAKGLGGLALSLAVTAVTQQNVRRQRAPKPYPRSLSGEPYPR